MPSRFLNNISINDEYSFPATDGSADQIIQTDGSGNLTFVDPSVLSVGESEQVHIACKNTSGVAISKGDPVYITGTVGTSFIIEIAAADASNSAKMPAVGLAETDLGINAEGFVIVSGVLKNLTTDPLSTNDGTPSSNDTVYVKAGGGLTRTKPTGSGNLIQNVGKVGRVNSANAGSLAVSTIMRTNDVPNLTTGKIWVGSPTYTTESTVVHLDETNGRMGIGTTSPSYTLDVSGSAGSTARFKGSGGQATVSINDGTNDNYIVAVSGDFQFRPSGTTVLTAKSTGNVGIGTTSPSEKLHVDGSSVISYSGTNANYFGQVNSGFGYGYIRPFNSSGLFGFDTNYTFGGGYDFAYNGASVVRISSAGNVGIGTTSPGQKLHIDGNIRVGDSADVIFSNRFYALSNAHVYLLANSGYDLKFYAGGTEKMVVNSAGNVGIGTTSPNYKLEVDGTFSSNAIWTTSSSVTEWGSGTTAYGTLTWDTGYAKIFANSGNQLQLAAGGASTDMTIDTSGNVGIGTTSPQDLLHLSADSPVLRLTNTVDTGKSSIEFWDNQSGTSQAGEVFYDDNSNLFGLQGNANGIVFRANNTFPGSTLMRLNGSGNLGIGTTTPGQRLMVASPSATSVVLGASYLSTNNNNFFEAGINANDGYLNLRNSGVVTTVHIDSDGNSYFNCGNVGIGTTSPSYTLDVGGAAKFASPVHVGSVTDALVSASGVLNLSGSKMSINSSTGAVGMSSYGSGTFTGTATQRLAVDSSGNVIEIPIGSGPVDGSGTANYVTKWSDADTITDSVIYDDGTNVGIGTSSPAQKLHVDGNIRVGDTNDVIYADKFFTVSNANLHIGANNGYDTVFFNGPADERMRITSSGNIGIGTTNPDYKLEVDGTLGVSRTDGIIFAGSTGTGTGSKIASNTSNDLIFSTALASSPYTTTERVRVLNNGFVGIGTDSPNELLEIKSATIPTIRLNSTDTTFPTFGSIKAYNNTTYRGELSWANNPVQAGAKITYIGFPSGSQKTGTFEVGADFVDTSINNGSMVTRLTTTGLGIGTTSPTATLQVDGSGLGAKIHSAQTTGLEVSGGGNSQDIARFQNVSGTTKVTIDTGGNVGIGTTSPNHTLDVEGGAQFNTNTGTTPFYITRLGGTSQALSIKVMDDNVRFESIQDEAADSYGGFDFRMDGGATEPNFTIRKNSADPILHVDGSGNVGIGTTSPTQKLHIDGTTSNTTGLVHTTTGLAIFRVATNNSDFALLGQGGSNRFDIYDNNAASTRFSINSSGNVGIGTTNPTQKLQVNGFIALQNGGYIANNINNKMFFHNSGGTFTTGYFSNLAIGGTYQATVPSDGLYVQGNVGIGTTSPSLTYANKGLHIENNDSAGIMLNDTTGAKFNIAARSSDVLLYTNTNHRLRFGINGQEKMRIETNGKVGIGTTNPSYKLDISGDLRVDNGNIGSTSGDELTHARIQGARHFLDFKEIRTANDTDWRNTTFKIQAGVDATKHQSIDFVSDNNYQEHIDILTGNQVFNTRFTYDGNVGIGTTSPGAKLDIFNTGGSAGSLADCQTYSALTIKPYSSVDSKLTFSANGVSTQLIQATNNAGTTGRQISLQPFSGNVGIGVTLPSEKLDVNGSIKASASTDAYKGYIKSVITTGYSMKSASTAYQYIPYNSYTLTTLQAYYNRTVAAYNGRVKKIIVKRIDGASADATGMKFKKEINGTVIATEYTATVLSGSGNFQATYDFAQTDFTFSAGDSIGVLMQSSGGTGMIGAGAIQIVLEYNIT